MRTPTPIVFGTSGWRAVIADQFTFAHVALVTRAIADYLDTQPVADQPVIVGYDTRFLADRFARCAADVLATRGRRVLLADRDVPTPVVAHAILHHQAAGGINLTASHNPPEYCGIKFSPAWGGPALPEATRWIEARIAALRECDDVPVKSNGSVESFNPRDAYVAHLRTMIDFPAIRAAKLRVAVDALYGTARGYLDVLLAAEGCDVTVVHDRPDPYFGGAAPDPSEHRLADLATLVREGRYHLGVATDGDADRFGVVDADGTYITANDVLALVVDYLIRTRGAKGGVARSVATSHLVDAVAARYGRLVYETGVGFKYIGRLIADGKVVAGGEEAQGLTIGGHVPDKDGILACLLLVEMAAKTGKPLRVQLEELVAAVGHRWYRRVDRPLSPDGIDPLRERLARLTRIGAWPIVRRNEVEGIVKLYVDESSWLIVRPSGTEPVVRVYAESTSRERADALLAAGKALAACGPEPIVPVPPAAASGTHASGRDMSYR
ncbi:MAG: phosphoglucomutase/phosphomannomutase family protein [Nitrospirota bacterium]